MSTNVNRTIKEGMSVLDVITWLFPLGTGEDDKSVDAAPAWPPDLFAACAVLIERSGCYTHPDFFLRTNDPTDAKDRSTIANSLKLDPDSQQWKLGYQEVNNDWVRLVSNYGNESSRAYLREDEPPPWCRILFRLLAIADEACDGIGFPGFRPDNFVLDQLSKNYDTSYAEEHDERQKRIVDISNIEKFDWDKAQCTFEARSNASKIDAKIKLPKPFHSLCYKIPDHIVCVQPKTGIPTLGFTIRSLSHNLALLPAAGEVTTFWYNLHFDNEIKPVENLNIMLIPYPYRIDGACFSQGNSAASNNVSTDKFHINQLWLEELLADDAIGDRNDEKWKLETQTERLLKGIGQLIEKSKREVGKIDGVVLPEFALTHRLAENVSLGLFATYELSFFVCGIRSHRETIHEGRRAGGLNRPINSVYSRFRVNFPGREQEGEIHFRRIQTKHHRWCMDKFQIKRYNLGPHLNPNKSWWEDTDIIEREALFWVLGNNVVMSTLICEDLARIDPVQQILRAMGPNLVISLLMDGPQMEHRWPGRYATSLADDPGCGVLTLTSLGMIRRTYEYSDNSKPRQVAIWKGFSEHTRELYLPKDAPALVVTLSTEQSPHPSANSLFSRQDLKGKNSSAKLSLSGVKAIYIKEKDKLSGSMFERCN